MVGRQHARAVELEARHRERPRRRAGRDDHVAAAQLGAVGDADRARVGVRACRCPGTIVTLRPFNSVSRPPTSRSTTACLRTCVSVEIDRGRRRVHAELGRALHGAQHLGRLEQLLGRDAPAVQAGAADPAPPRRWRCACPPTRRRARPRSRPDRRRARPDRSPATVEFVGQRPPTSPGRSSAPRTAARRTPRESRAREPRENDVRARAHAARLALGAPGLPGRPRVMSRRPRPVPCTVRG